ncbi:hypothetical protein R9C00_16265 [Flammeovirgaceae bacterium SG7u.111]|nr:hypothetical protein [Flammeovirgaceae bacterium SG7u.132]WPO33258.1 hypothetical protein R9C00_16265 [Flammeovirgaceae bacterium SG7u.111]
MKKILITVCSTGFGYMSAKYFTEQGHQVYATMRNIDGKNSIPAANLTQNFSIPISFGNLQGVDNAEIATN